MQICPVSMYKCLIAYIIMNHNVWDKEGYGHEINSPEISHNFLDDGALFVR